jgi:hypothetical protein
VLARLEQHLIEHVEDLEQLELIDRGIRAMKTHHLKVEMLQSNVAVQILLDEGVRVNIVLLMQRQAKAFKKTWQATRAAAGGLLNI